MVSFRGPLAYISIHFKFGLLFIWQFKDDFKHISFIKLEIGNLLGNASKKVHSNFKQLLLFLYVSMICTENIIDWTYGGLYHSEDL